MRDRISAAACKVGYSGDLTELRVSTIHSLCHGLLAVHRHRTVLGNNFETLDELTQLLFIFDNFDEYQDTNYIQEQLLLRLAAQSQNICVVGDEDQSLYRFRGATVRNILGFPDRVPGCQTIKLITNYRSHRQIVAAYDRWMASATWTENGRRFRFNKTIKPDPKAEHPEYPSVFCISGQDAGDEAERFADLVQFLKRENVIQDYSQVALLLHSVRLDHSGPFIDALDKKGIPAFCPRARAYFENEEVRLMVACLALIFGYHGNGRGQVSGSLAELAQYIDEGILDLGRRFGGKQPLAKLLQQFVRQIQKLRQGEALDMRPADYFFRLLAVPPFDAFLANETRTRNLAIFSQLINTFQNYYHYTVVTFKNREYLRFHLFASFIRLLYDGGINEYEDPDQPFVDATRRDSLPGVIPHLTRSARPSGTLWTKHISVAVL